jgi:hypothetical protein
MAAPCPALRRDAAGVSPVVGTVLVLAISVLGMAGVLYWGAPTIDRIQSRNAQAAIEGEFEGLRDASQELSVPDHSRFPTVALPGGTLAVQQGTRFLVAADQDTANAACDLHVTDWSDSGANKDRVTVSATGCRTPTTTCTPLPLASGVSCLEVYSVGGTTTVRQTTSLSGGTATISGANTSRGDWLFRLTDGNASPVVYAQAWLHSTDQLAWSLKTSTTSRSITLDGGAIFSNSDGTYFLEKEAAIGDTSFGTGYYGFWLRSLLASSYSAIDGQGSHQVFLSLLGNSVRVDSNTVTKLRFDFSGTLAQSWCNAMVGRNPHLTNAAYAASAGFTCASGDASGLRSVTYTCSDATNCPSGVFKFRFLHARIDASLSI